jgi:hypothetical protein
MVVGGLASVLNGAPVNTFDIDLVHSRNDTNIARLLQVLEERSIAFSRSAACGRPLLTLPRLVIRISSRALHGSTCSALSDAA